MPKVAHPNWIEHRYPLKGCRKSDLKLNFETFDFTEPFDYRAKLYSIKRG